MNKGIFESGVAQKYSSFLVDVWGVIHSGGVLYPNTQRTMEEMMKRGKVVLLSNAPRRAAKVKGFLHGIGIYHGVHYSDILTSGEAFIIHAQKSRFKTIFYIGPQKDMDIFDLNDDMAGDLQAEQITITNDINADFDEAIVTGLTIDGDLSQDIKTLEMLLKKNVALSCVNPDIVVKNASGDMMLCAGAVAREYEKMGGKVIYYGKPYEEVYNIAIKMLGVDVERSEILAIGDGMETDILGACNAGIDSALCACGIHEQEISWNGFDFFKNFKQKPTFLIENIASVL